MIFYRKAEINKKLILPDVYAGKETPYYYVGEGNMTVYICLGNESVPADNITLKRLRSHLHGLKF